MKPYTDRQVAAGVEALRRFQPQEGYETERARREIVEAILAAACEAAEEEAGFV